MSNFFPLIANVAANVIQELPVGSFLDLSQSGIANSGNISVSGIVSATGNISGNYFIGNGSLLTGISGSANTGNVGFDNNNIYNTQGGGLILSNFNYVTAEAETAYVNIPAGNSPSDLQIVQEQGNVTINANSSAVWSFNADKSLRLPNNANITIVDNTITEINAVATANSAIGLRAFDNNGNTTASSFFDGTDGTLNFYSYNPGTDTNYNWRFDNGGSFTLPNAPGNVYFGELANGPVIIPYNAGITLNANRADAEASYINLDQNGLILLTPGSIQIDNSSATSLGNDINLLSGDDIRLSGRNKPNDSENEGGDINIYAGQGADAVTNGFDTGGGGDIQIGGGVGGSDTGGGFGASSGGFVNITGGEGGTSSTTNVGSGGTVTITAGSAGSTGNTQLGGYGGGVNISAGRTTRTNENGGSIEITAGEASGDGTGIAGYVAINIPTSATAIGGTWTFGGTGTTLNVPANAEIYGANFGNFTVGCAGNTIVTSSDYGANVKNWVFGYTGNLLAPGNIITPTNFVGTSLRTNLSNFNWSEAITNITLGTTTTVTLANNVFGDPWTGQVTITDVTGTTEANATWWYEAVDGNQFVLYTDSTLSTLVDSSEWTAYISGGVATTLDYGNISINAQTITLRVDHGDYNNRTWQFNQTGQTVFPYQDVVRGDIQNGNITGYAMVMGDGTGEAIISTPNGNSTYNNSQRLVINPGKGADGTGGEGGDIYLWAGRGGDTNGNGGDVKVRGGYGPGNGQGGYIRIEAGDVQGAGTAGYSLIRGGDSGGSTGGYVSLEGGRGNDGNGGYINIQGGSGSVDGGNVTIQGGISDQGLAHYGNIVFNSGAMQWRMENTGNLTLPQGGVIYENNIPFGGLSGKTISLAPYGGTSADQQLLVYPTAGPDANHLHLTSGNLYNTELFLGNDDLYVKLANTGNVVINSNDGGGNSAQWVFDTTGTLTTPGSGGDISGANVVSAVTFSATGVVKTGVFVTGNILGAATVGAGARAFVSDADIKTWGNLYVGGGGNTVPVWSDGANWYIG